MVWTEFNSLLIWSSEGILKLVLSSCVVFFIKVGELLLLN